MKRIYKHLIIINVLLISLLGSVMNAQIFEPEGLNLPGTWNNFTNPPADGSAFGSSTQVNGGVSLIDIGLRRWQTTIHITESGADTSAGFYTWLFTSGPQGNPYANKWAGVNVVMNTIQDYQFNTGADNGITLENDMYYTFNWQDQGYQSTRAIVMPTSGHPVTLDQLNFSPANPSSAEGVNVTIELSSAPSPEEFVFVRYSVDAFASSEIVVCEINGNLASAQIPALPNGSSVSFYAFSSTIEIPENDFDLITLNFLNDGGLNFTYEVQDATIEVDLGPDLVLCQGVESIGLSAGDGFDTYLWSTGDITPSILVAEAGQYFVEVSLNGLIARDTIQVAVSQIPAFNLGDDISSCGGTPINLSSGINLSSEGQLLTIVYDATQGLSNLAGAQSVYMHSTYEAVPFGGPVEPWVGNWGQDDGLGQMTQIGEDLWSITIDVFDYYGIPEGTTSISGLFIVFRNADGTAEGKDDNGNDIFLNLQGATPVSGFSGITASYTEGTYASIAWNTGENTSSIEVSESGIYSAVAITTDGCEYTDEIEVTFSDFNAPDLPNEVFICEGSVNLDAGAGYASYLWSTGATTQTIEVAEAGTYSVLVSDGADCSASDSVVINSASFPSFDLGADTTICSSGTFVLSTGLAISAAGDSLTIRYDASTGVSGLEGASKVYMHSGIALAPQGAWNNVVGNWGQDDGIGEMTPDPLFENVWTITINPYAYYNLAEGADFEGIWMVFRNEDGSTTGKNENNQDIYINTSAYPSLNSTFGGVTASVQPGEAANLVWSTGEESSSIEIAASGIYWAEISQGDCTFRDSIEVTFIELPDLNLSSDTAFCGTLEPFTISAAAGYESYTWSNGEITPAIEVTEAGTYVLTATFGVCTVIDSVRVQDNAAVGLANLGPDRALCGGETLTLDPGISISPFGDLLTITYDATQGQSGLQGAASVYMHSTYEAAPFGGPVEPWVGNWGQDDGIGEMTQIGENLWSITINVYAYYGISPGDPLAGLFIVFRNADGTAEGKDENGNDIYLNLQGDEPFSAFGGVSASIEVSEFNSILWSTGETTPNIQVNSPGIYSVTLFGNSGCNASDTVSISTAPAPIVELGPNQILCNGESTTLTAGSGFSSYLWSTGATTPSINVTNQGNYTVTVTNAEGCEAVDNIGITTQVTPNASFSWIETGGLGVSFTYTGTGSGQFAWDFDNDGSTDNTNINTASFTYPDTGIYTATLVVSNACGIDTTSVQLNLIGLGTSISDKSGFFIMYPNPAKDYIRLMGSTAVKQVLISDVSGRLIKQFEHQNSSNVMDISDLASGIYYLTGIFSNGTSASHKLIVE